MGFISNGGGGGGGVISGVTVTGTAASGQVPVASSSSAGSWSYPPGYEIGYDQITAPVTVTSTTEATPTTIITCAAHTFDGGAVMLEVYFPEVTIQTAASFTRVNLWEGATNLGRLAQFSTDANADVGTPAVLRLRFTPSAASHTYVINGFGGNATGTIYTAGVGGSSGVYAPAFARFTKC